MSSICTFFRLDEDLLVNEANAERYVSASLPKSAIWSNAKKKQLIVFVWTQVRSGSTLTAKLLSLLPRTYYSIEPIRTMLSLRFPDSHTNKFKLHFFLRSLMKCHIDQNEDYLHARQLFNVKHDTLNEFCIQRALNDSSADYLCHDGAFRSFMCNWADIHLLKIVSIQLHTVLDFLDDPSLNIKILHLLRDPRGIIVSISRIPGFESFLYEPNFYCQNMREDLRTATIIEEKHPNR